LGVEILKNSFEDRSVHYEGCLISKVPYVSVSQPPGRGPVPGPGINYIGS